MKKQLIAIAAVTLISGCGALNTKNVTCDREVMYTKDGQVILGEPCVVGPKMKTSVFATPVVRVDSPDKVPSFVKVSTPPVIDPPKPKPPVEPPKPKPPVEPPKPKPPVDDGPGCGKDHDHDWK